MPRPHSIFEPMPDWTKIGIILSGVVALFGLLGWVIDVSFESGMLEGRIAALEATVNSMRHLLLRLLQGEPPAFDTPGM